MHEFSLAQSIVEIIEETVKRNNLTQVSEVLLEIGTLSGVEIHALDMALECLKEGSVIEDAVIRKLIVKARASCLSCKFEFEPEELYSPCPECGNFGMDVNIGKEFRVKSIIAE